MSVTYKLYQDPRSYRDLVYPFLLRDEAAHCLGIGVIHNLVERPEMHLDFHLAAFFEASSQALLGAAWITAPHPLGVSHLPAVCLPSLLHFASSLPRKPPGISAPFAIAEGFRSHWMKAERCTIQQKFSQCIYKVDEANLITRAASQGVLRLAVAHDAKLLSRWSWEFVVDCKMAKGKDRGHGKTYARQAIYDKSRYIWEVDGKSVAMAGVQGATPGGIRISWVYTPPEHRGNGYASELVTAVCRDQFRKGKKNCFLYTDLENPTSNRIYQKIGFQPVDNPLHYIFSYSS